MISNNFYIRHRYSILNKYYNIHTLQKQHNKNITYIYYTIINLAKLHIVK